MGKSQRTKGHNFERQTAIRWRSVFPEARRRLEYQEGYGIDLEKTGNLNIQTKAYKKYAPISKIFEIPDEAGKIAVLITKGDRQDPMAVMRERDLIKLLQDVGVVYDD